MVIVSGHVQCQEFEDPHWNQVKCRGGGRGDIFYVPPQSHVRLISLSSEPVLAYRTFSYEIGPDHSNRSKLIAFDKKGMPLHDPLHGNSVLMNGAEFFDETIE
jgi:hypothetical protein